MRLTFMQGVTRGPMGKTTVSLPGGFEPDSTVMVVVPTGGRSEPPTPDEFEEDMLGDRDNFEEGIMDRDRVDLMRVLEVNTNEVPNTGKIEIEPEQRTVKALVVELRTSITPEFAQQVNERMRRELNSTFYLDTFARVV